VKAASSEEAAFLRNHEGAIGFGLETDSAERALALLSSRGITAKISTTTSDEYVVAGERTAPTWLWRDIDLPKGTPGSPFLVEYNLALRAARAKNDPAAEQKRALARIQPNGATRRQIAAGGGQILLLTSTTAHGLCVQLKQGKP